MNNLAKTAYGKFVIVWQGVFRDLSSVVVRNRRKQDCASKHKPVKRSTVHGACGYGLDDCHKTVKIADIHQKFADIAG